MNTNIEILQSIGWALVHSVWQSALLFSLYNILARAIANHSAHHRYLLGLGTLCLSFVAFCATVIILDTTSTITVVDTGAMVVVPTALTLTTATTSVVHSLDNIRVWIDQNILWVLRVWLVGSFIAMLRIVAGVAYLYFLRQSALPVAGAWEEKVQALATSLNISRRVTFAEARVSTPIVLGILKPIVLFPVGLMAGLTPAQIEAILIHELAHIRRHDFIINLFQCVMESIFFFNPFVWLLSAKVRVLREHCCDDAVVGRGVEPLLYVKTLAYVEEVSNSHILAPALTGERNQLLNRMKRIMEKTVVKKELGRLRLLPTALAILGLICASWLSIGSEVNDDTKAFGSASVTVDTLIAHDGEELAAIFKYQSDSHEEAEVDAESNDLHDAFTVIAPMPAHEWSDSIPGFFYSPDADWGRFEKEFTSKFRKEFGEFYNKNREQFDKMMEEMRKQNETIEQWTARPDMNLWQLHKFDEQFADQMRSFQFANPPIPNLENFAIPNVPVPDEAWGLDAFDMEEQAKLIEKMFNEDSQMFRLQEQLRELEEWHLLGNESTMARYEEALVEQLVEDGYIKKGEKVDDLHIYDDEVTVNGKKVKEKDLAKYKALRDKYQPRLPRPYRAE